ncbi:MAG: nucleoside kinase [Evtepia sp.]|jgi:uridine kinase|nr:nucleoside kinase [Evtepia sp.]
MTYQLQEINEAVLSDAKGFLADCDEHYQDRINNAAEVILNNMSRSQIVLLSGPSSSGKTTTAMKIEQELRRRGISTKTISMDNYFRPLDLQNAPRNENGEVDYESPSYMDMNLLLEHFSLLEAGKEILVPKFDFANQRRNESLAYPLRLSKNEIAIFEGIHALNDDIAGRYQDAIGIYLSARSSVMDGDDLRFKSTWMRLTRRVVRDHQFRGTGVAETLNMWANVRRGEKLYIDPFKDRAKITIDSSFPYEVSVMKAFAKPLLDSVFQEVPETTPGRDELLSLINAFSDFEPINPSLVHPDALLREFIGGGSYHY